MLRVPGDIQRETWTECQYFPLLCRLLWVNPYAISSTGLARSIDVVNSMHVPFAKLVTLRRRIKIVDPFDACSRFPLMNSAVHEMFFGRLHFPVDCTLIYPRIRRTKFSPFSIGFAFLGDASFEDLNELLPRIFCIFR